jgi:hypothetical protein
LSSPRNSATLIIQAASNNTAAVLYISSTRLMRESEQAVREHASCGEEITRRACSQLLGNEPRYMEWHARHENKMRSVADARRRDPQVLGLRSVAIEQVHRTALVDYLRLGRITGTARNQTLALFHGVSDPRDATLAEHRTYVIAASTRVCGHELLELVGDREGLDLIRRYELAYGQYFAMFCERARSRQTGEPYLLSSLLPEVKAVADRLRLQVVGSGFRLTEIRRPPVAAAHTAWLARMPLRVRALRDLAHGGPRAASLPASPPARTRTAR